MEQKKSSHSQDNLKKKKKLESSHYLISNDITRLLYSKQHCTGTKTEIETNGTEQRHQRQHNISTTIQSLIHLTKTSNEERIPCLINGVGETD